MNKEGKTETLSLLRGMSIFYYDAWIYGSSLELRKRNVHHDRIYDICPAVIYPRMKVIPELTRNGFKGAFYDICPSSFFMTLLTDNRMEILYKAGQMNLFLRFLERKYGIDKYWTYVKICLRHDYVIHDADLWLDYVDMLIENKLDARNPHYLCPLNVEEAHDWVMGKCKKKYSEKDEKTILLPNHVSLIFRLRMEILWFGYWKAFRTFTKRESCCIIVYSATPIIREKIR